MSEYKGLIKNQRVNRKKWTHLYFGRYLTSQNTTDISNWINIAASRLKAPGNWALSKTDKAITAPFIISFAALPQSLPVFNSFRFLVADLARGLAISDPETY